MNHVVQNVISRHNLLLIHGKFSRNFVVQHLLGLGDVNLNEKICFLLKGKFVELSSLRYGSHLVEKCLKSPGMARYVVNDLLKINDYQLLQLAKHRYGNFVVQRALKITKVYKIFTQILTLKIIY